MKNVMGTHETVNPKFPCNDENGGRHYVIFASTRFFHGCEKSCVGRPGYEATIQAKLNAAVELHVLVSCRGEPE